MTRDAHPLDRREFLGRGAAVAAGLAAGPAFLRAAEPGKKLVVGVMGLGRGLDHVKACLGLPEVEIAYVCDVDDRRVQRALSITLPPGTHLDLIGSFAPQMRESDGECFARSRVFVDTDEALAKSGDVLGAIADGAFEPARLQGTLAQLCRGERPGRDAAREITLFKAVGNALEDLAAAERVADAMLKP